MKPSRLPFSAVLRANLRIRTKRRTSPLHRELQQLETLPSTPRTRSHQRSARMEGGAIGTRAAAALLRVNPSKVMQAAFIQILIAWLDGRGRAQFPSWQFRHGSLLTGLVHCLHSLGTAHPAVSLPYFLTPLRKLRGRRRIDLLRENVTTETVIRVPRATARLAARYRDMQVSPLELPVMFDRCSASDRRFVVDYLRSAARAPQLN